MKEVKAFRSDINGETKLFLTESECSDYEYKYRKLLDNYEVLNHIIKNVTFPNENQFFVKFEVSENLIITKTLFTMGGFTSNRPIIHTAIYSQESFVKSYMDNIKNYCSTLHKETRLLEQLKMYDGKFQDIPVIKDFIERVSKHIEMINKINLYIFSF